MQILVTRFHLLLLTVTLAITGVGLFRIPPDYVFPAHWSGSAADWLWPREVLIVAPLRASSAAGQVSSSSVGS